MNNSIIIGIIVVAICVVPIIIIVLNGQKKKNVVINSLKNFANETQHNIKSYDIWQSNVIGIDNSELFVFALIKHNDETQKYFIDLNKVKSCEVINDKRSADVIARIGLDISYKGSDQENSVIEFYKIGGGIPVVSVELQLANKWQKLIEEKLNLLK